MGPSVMLATARFLLVEPPRQQRPYSRFVPRFAHGDRPCCALASPACHTAGLNIGELAAMAGLGARTFLRRFVQGDGAAPDEPRQQLRIVSARGRWN